jgi:hypothetical protein
VNGRLPPETITRVFALRKGQMRACYEGALRRSPAAHGKVVFRFVIDRAGVAMVRSVGPPAEGGGGIRDEELHHCLQLVLKDIAFPDPEGGVVMVQWTYRFSPAGIVETDSKLDYDALK